MSIETRERPEAPEDRDTDGPDLSVRDLLLRIYRLFHNKRFGLALILGLGLATLLGILFPQAPGGVLDDPQLREAWLDSVRPRFRGWTEPLATIGMFGVFGSVWFRAITAGLVLSIVACTVHRLPQLWTQATRPRTHVKDTFFDHARFTASTIVAGDPAEAVQRVKDGLHARRFRTITEPWPIVRAESSSTVIPAKAGISEPDRWTQAEASADGFGVYADRNRFAPLGTVLAHLGFVVILAGVLVTSTFGFRVDDVAVPVGARVEVGGGTGLAIEARSFTDTYHPDGSPADYVSDLVLFHDGVAVAQQEVRVNAPLRWHGFSVNQSFFGIAADLVVTDAAGRQVFAGAVPLTSQTSDGRYSYGKFNLPDQHLLVYVITPASGQVVPDIPAGQAELEIYAEDADQPLASQVLTPGQPAQLGDLNWTFARERQFTGLMVSRDPGAPWVWAGCALFVIGTCWTMFWRHHRIWLRLVRDGDRTLVRVASPDRHDVSFTNELTAFTETLSVASAPRR